MNPDRMATTDPPVPDRRSALITRARRLTAEAGADAGCLLDPALATDLAIGLAADVAAAIEERTANVATVDEFVEALLDAVLEASEPWRDGLALANMALERAPDFGRWEGLLGPWLKAVEDAIRAAQERGVVRGDVEPRETALVLRDALDRTVKVTLRFEHDGYRQATAALVRAALRA